MLNFELLLFFSRLCLFDVRLLFVLFVFDCLHVFGLMVVRFRVYLRCGCLYISFMWFLFEWNMLYIEV